MQLGNDLLGKLWSTRSKMRDKLELVLVLKTVWLSQLKSTLFHTIRITY